MKADVLPAPMQAPEVDLRGYDHMPLYGDRLFKSETWIEASADGKLAALRLWWQAFAHEAPAGSLPSNDRLLAEYAGYGIAIDAFKAIKAEAMRGFVLCNDDRWYHPMVCEIARVGWKERLRNRKKVADWRERNRNKDGNNGFE